MAEQASEEYRELKSSFTEFLDQDVRGAPARCSQHDHGGRRLSQALAPSVFRSLQHGHGDYPHAVREMMQASRSRLQIDAGHLRSFDPGLAESTLNAPATALPALEEALDDVVRNLDSKYLSSGRELRVGIIGR